MSKKVTNIPVAETDSEKIASLRHALLTWYRQHQRDLPWRHTRDPYRILVSEIMLQQTQVDRVIPKYHQFLDRFPTLRDLADAPTSDVIRIWSGLGYNRRALNLQRAAQAVVERHGGVMPGDIGALRELPGIGPYTAGAVACFAFEQDVGFFDTNIRRVLHRLFFGAEIPDERATPRQIQERADQLVPDGQGYEWNQALMEFGAVQCTARKPACLTCPLQTHCRAFPGIQTALATRSGRTKQRQETPFTGSSRYYRGRVIETLRGLPDGEALGIRDLGPLIRDDYGPEHLSWLRKIIDGLHRDGLAAVAEERAGYDTGEPDDVHVRLPSSTSAGY